MASLVPWSCKLLYVYAQPKTHWNGTRIFEISNLNTWWTCEHFHPLNLIKRQILSSLFQHEITYTIFPKLKMQCPSRSLAKPSTLNHMLSNEFNRQQNVAICKIGCKFHFVITNPTNFLASTQCQILMHIKMLENFRWFWIACFLQIV